MKREIALGLALAALSCAHPHGSTSEASTAAAPPQVRVHVTNNYSVPVDIWALGAGIRQRLGTVAPGIARTFTLDPAIAGSGLVELAADIGPNDSPVWSGQVQIATGDQIDFEIATHPAASRIRVRAQ